MTDTRALPRTSRLDGVVTQAEAFTGFPDAGFSFYERLAADNSKTWFTANRETFDSAVQQPMRALLAELADEFGAGKVFRPYRDPRFSRDKSSYIKDHQGGFIGVEEAVGYYVQISAEGLMAGGGWYAPIGDQLARFREVINSGSGAEFAAILAAVRRSGMQIDGNEMATRPRGVAADHPDLQFLRMRRVVATRSIPAGTAWLSTRSAFTKVRKDLRAITPLVEWLGEKVGPGAQPEIFD